MSLGDAEDDAVPCDAWWPVLFFPGLQAAGLLCYRRGFFLRQDVTRRLLLLNKEEQWVDYRVIRSGEMIVLHFEVWFPYHVVHVGVTLYREGAVHGEDSEVSSLTALLWAMEETEAGNPSQAVKWWAFKSRRRAPTGPEELEVGWSWRYPPQGPG